MPNGHGPKEYGGHEYPDDDGTSDCRYGCGCWMGPTRSGGPMGLDPDGICPNNPVDGKLLGGKDDYQYVVEKRIESLSSRAASAEYRLGRVSPSKIKLADELDETRAKLANRNQFIARLRQLLETVTGPIAQMLRPASDNFKSWLFLLPTFP